MASLPIYDPAGTQRTQAQRPNQVSDDMFGGAQGRALQQAGNALQNTGRTLLQIENEEKERDDASDVTALAAEGSNQMREKMWGEGGLMEQTGDRAKGIGAMAQSDAERIGQDLKGNLSTPEQQAAFDRVWRSFTDTNVNTATKFEFDQRKATRTSSKTAALAAIENDALAGYMNEETVNTQKDLARTFIRANADGLPQDAVSQLEKETVSKLNLSVIQRLALDDPGMALDYYTRHKGEINGLDHAEATKMVGAIANIREVKTTVSSLINQGPANDIADAVEFAESSNRGVDTPPSSAGALGAMQVMPGTARETAVTLGMSNVAAMSDKEMQDYFATPEGMAANKRLGRAYLGQMMNKFSRNGKADLEAALVAYNAGPANGEKWLNAGRDYSVLPNPQETLPYVKKVLGAYRKTSFDGADTSERIQQTLSGTVQTYFNGDSKEFLKTRLQSQHGSAHIDGMSNDLSDRLAAMLNDAPDYVKQGADILSGYRSVDRQTELWNEALAKYGSASEARKWVAPPPGVEGSKGSQHNHGNAADLGWNGGRFSSAPKQVREWIHANAANYGLNFPMGNEPWHIETQEARGGQSGKRSRPNYADARISGAFSNDKDGDFDNSGYIQVQQNQGSAADLYAKFQQPFQVDIQSGGSLQSALNQVREIYADNPTKLAEAERQITNEHQTRQAASKEQVEQLKTGLLRQMMVGGESPRDADPNILAAIGPEGVTQLFNLEDNLKRGGARTTDDQTYIELVNMTPEELQAADLLAYSDKLSREDLQQFANKQAEYKRGGNDELRASTMTRSQIVSGVENQLGFSPSTSTDHAKAMAQFNRALDLKISAYVAREKRQPDGIELQKYADELLIEGKVSGGGILSSVFGDTKKRIFQLEAGEASDFYVASSVADIPTQIQPQVATTYRSIYSVDPGEDEAVTLYNDMVKIQAGASPMPPAPLTATIKQRFVAKFGRAPLPDEIARVYRKRLEKAAISNGNGQQ